jgi:hypothetical protein
MNEIEEIVFKTFEENFVHHVDPVSLTRALICAGLLSQSDQFHIGILNRQGNDIRKLWTTLMSIIPQQCPMRTFCKVLCENGCQETAMCIDHRYRVLKHVPKPEAKTSSAREGQTLYMDCKMAAHNNLSNPQAYCRSKSKPYQFLFENEQNLIRKQKYADIYVAGLSAEISSYIMQYDKTRPLDEFFSELKKIIHHTSNTHLVTISYASHQALVCSICERFEDAETHIQNGLESSFYVESCVELVNFFYARLFFLLAKYKRCPSKSLQQEILKAAEVNLNILEEEPDEGINLFWKRMILLRMAFCLLGLDYKGSPIAGLLPDKYQTVKAKTLLADVYKLRKGIDVRRQMAYDVAQVRVAELENSTTLDLELLNNVTKDYDTGGNYGETTFIKQYADKLRRTHKHDNNIDTCVKEVSTSTCSRTVTAQRPYLQRHVTNKRPQIIYSELLDGGNAVKEYFTGAHPPVINLHGQDTVPKH